MNEILQESVYFGFILSLICYFIGMWCKKKLPYSFVNPLLVAMLLIIVFLIVFRVDYETYDYGAKYITFFMTPATVCLAVPLYRQFEVLRKNAMAVMAGILAGCISHACVILGIALLINLDKVLLASMLPKSVTTAIAIGICEEIGGIVGITILGTTIAGLGGAIIGPSILKLFKVKEPVAQGLALGTASHAIGTSQAIELGEVQAAMSSLAIVVTGIITVAIVPIVMKFI